MPRSPRRPLLGFDVLEDRLTPAISVNYNAGVLTLAGTSGADNVSITSPGMNKLRIQVQGDTLARAVQAITVGALSSGGTTLDIDTSQTPVTTLLGNFGGGADVVSFTNDAANGLGGVFLDAGGGADVVTLGTVAIGGSLQVVSGGSITLTGAISTTAAGFGNHVSLILTNPGGTVSVNQTITTDGASADGDVSITADNVAISRAINAGSGTVTILALTANRPVSLGAEVADSLSLTDAELDLISAGVIEIGKENAGAITVGGGGSVGPDHAGALSLTTGSSITQLTGSPLVAKNVTFRASAGSDITLDNPANDLSGTTTILSARNVTLSDANLLSIGAASLTGDLTLTAADVAFGSANSVTGSATSRVVLQPLADLASIGLGGSVGTFGVTQADLDAFSDGFASITIGRATGQHAITVSAITFRDPVTIRTPAGGTVTVNGLVTGTGDASVTVDAPLGTTTLNAGVTTSGQDVRFTGDVKAGANFTIDTGAGNITFAKLLDVGSKLVTLKENGAVDLGTSTTLAGGTLTATHGLTLGSGDKLSGSGSISADVLVQSGGRITPGPMAGSFTFTGGLTLQPGASYDVDLDGAAGLPAPGTQYDQARVTGGVSLGGATLNLTKFGSTALKAGDAFVILRNDGSGAVSGTFANLPEGAAVLNGALRITYKGGDGNDVALVVVVPGAPTLTAGPVSGFEGRPIALNLTASLARNDGSETLSIEIAGVPANVVFNNGVVNPGTGTVTVTPAQLAGLTLTAPDNTAFNLTVTAKATKTASGAMTETQAIVPVTVQNVAPTVTITGPRTANPAVPCTLTLAASDPGADTIQSWTINWGDGTVETVTGNPTAVTHSYPLIVGGYTITATATDEDGTYTANALAVSMRFGTPNQAFVARSWFDLVGKPIDAGTFGALVARLDGGTLRSLVVRDMTRTPEYQTKSVRDAFQSILGRQPTDGELAWGLAQLARKRNRDGNTVRGIDFLRAQLFASAEYLKLRGNGTSSGFLAAIKRDAPGSKPQSPSAIKSKAARLAAVLDTLAANRQNQVQALYRRFLNQPADKATLKQWTRQLNRKASEEDVISGIMGTDAYFTVATG